MQETWNRHINKKINRKADEDTTSWGAVAGRCRFWSCMWVPGFAPVAAAHLVQLVLVSVQLAVLDDVGSGHDAELDLLAAVPQQRRSASASRHAEMQRRMQQNIEPLTSSEEGPAGYKAPWCAPAAPSPLPHRGAAALSWLFNGQPACRRAPGMGAGAPSLPRRGGR